MANTRFNALGIVGVAWTTKSTLSMHAGAASSAQESLFILIGWCRLDRVAFRASENHTLGSACPGRAPV